MDAPFLFFADKSMTPVFGPDADAGCLTGLALGLGVLGVADVRCLFAGGAAPPLWLGLPFDLDAVVFVPEFSPSDADMVSSRARWCFFPGVRVVLAQPVV